MRDSDSDTNGRNGKTGTSGNADDVAVGAAGDEVLFGRVASILEQARANVVRAVNHNMVVAYWLIGREIVMELQRGQERAGYGERVINELSARLTSAYGKGYSGENLWIFKKFYLSYRADGQILYTVCTEFAECRAVPEVSQVTVPEFSPRLTWSHYRVLMRIANLDARNYYETEAAAADWSVRQLERQIHTHAWERLVKTPVKRTAKSKAGARQESADQDVASRILVKSDAGAVTPGPLDSLKDPYVLEFLDIPDPAALHESGIEASIITHLRDFLLEIGKGFAFVARQKRLSFDDEHLYVDLVFYSIPLRCYLLIDLKTGKLTHADVGQMDGYIRMFDDLMAGPEDNPTIGLILCTEHNSAVARYSLLNDRRQIFASRYVTCLPTEAELAAEVQRGRALIEARGDSDR